MTESITRSVEIVEAPSTELREFVGLVAPYNEVITVSGYKERYEKGVFADAPNVQIYWNHDIAGQGGSTPIGRVQEFRETDAGLEVVGKIAATARGDEVLTLMREGVLDSLSANFYPSQSRLDEDVTVYEKAELLEVSVVGRSAYPGAKISEVRSEGTSNNTKEEVSVEDTDKTQMTENNIYDDSEIRSGLSDLERRIEVMNNKEDNSTAPTSKFRSAGEVLKGLATNDGDAQSELRAFVGADGAKLSDSHASNDWKNDLLKIVDRGRPVVNLFDKAPLGPTGSSVEYPRISAVTGDVARQVAEGDNLAYIEVGITTATAPINTYGGYSELSRQVIERSDVSYLDAVLRAQAASYGKVTNGVVRTALTGATPQTSGVASFALTGATAGTFVAVVADAVQKIDTNGYYGNSADFMLVSWDVYNKMVSLTDASGRPVFDLNNDGSNTFGDVNIQGVRASVAGLPVVVDSALAAKTLYVCNRSAVTTWENPGAPVRLQDENIIALTKQFSLYGYLAAGVKDANGLVKATIS